MSGSAADRIAAAPISWGVCEVPGWGHQLPPRTVLGQMHELNIAATELGPDSFLPTDPEAAAALLRSYDLDAVGGFVPVVLHDGDPLPAIEPALRHLTAAGATILVLAAATGRDGYDERPTLDDGQWAALLENLDRIRDVAAERGVTATLHPHVGTMVQRRDEVDRVLAGSDVPLCLDTGHLLIGGTDPVDLARQVPDRIAHTHLKDVDAALAGRVQRGEVGYTEAVRRGVYHPLGAGDIDIAAIVTSLEGSGYRGWYVMEQDAMLDTEPAPDEGPIADVRASLEFLGKLAA
ncbi:MAG: sugar phosphate isomerase/epimerase family protein [Nocardioidaceae bacterium]